MQSKKNIIIPLIVVFMITVTLSACAPATPTEDPMLKITQVAGTIQADLTQAAALTPSATATLAATATPTLMPPTETPSGPTNTPTKTAFPTAKPGSAADNSVFVSDVNVPDGSDFARNEVFVKTWRFRNTGTTTWSKGYKLAYIDGDSSLIGSTGAYYVYLPSTVEPGNSVDISISLKAPGQLGTYTSWWKLYNDQNVPFGGICRVVIDVTEKGHQ
jgi:hypothetical protein